VETQGCASLSQVLICAQVDWCVANNPREWKSYVSPTPIALRGSPCSSNPPTRCPRGSVQVHRSCSSIPRGVSCARGSRTRHRRSSLVESITRHSWCSCRSLRKVIRDMYGLTILTDFVCRLVRTTDWRLLLGMKLVSPIFLVCGLG
jgi:hypothetical protein